MKGALDFEMRLFPADEYGEMLPEKEETITENCRESSARGRAGRIAKRINGPVDLAFAGDEPWEERYVTTAMPCEFAANGFRFERLTN